MRALPGKGCGTTSNAAQKITGLLEAVETVGRLCREIEAENRSVHSAGIAKRAEAISRLLEKCVNDYFDTSEEP